MNKKFLYWLPILLWLLVLPSCGSNPKNDEITSNSPFNLFEGSSTKFAFTTPKFALITTNVDHAAYSVITYKSQLVTVDKGFAELPFASTTLQIADRENTTLIITPGDYEEIQLLNPLKPSKGVIYRDQNPAAIPLEIAPESLTDSWYPGDLALASDPFILRDIRGVSIKVFPFQYNAQKNLLRVYKNITVTLRNTAGTPLNPLVNTAAKNPILPIMDNIYKTVFANYSAPVATAATEIGDILVLVTSRDAKAIEPYIDWKQQKGFKVTTKEVRKGINAKSIIADYYKLNNNLLYVQLVGGWDDIKSDLGPSAAPMDPMLGRVVGDDHFADIMIGRFSAAKANEVKVQVDKTIRYEKYPDVGATWYQRGLGIASDEGAGAGDDGESDYEHMDIIKNHRLLKFTYNEVFEAYKRPLRSRVEKWINDGVSIINYAGHGSRTSWLTSGYNLSSINASTNGSALPFIISVACVNGAFHQSGITFAESFLRKEGGGAIAALMSTINQPWQPPMRGQDYMNDLLIGGYDYTSQPGNGINVAARQTTFGAITFNGMALMYAESNTTSDLETIKTWTLFGDASLEVRTDKPKPIQLANIQAFSGAGFESIIFSGNKPVEGAVVTLSQSGQSFSAMSDSTGSVRVEHTLPAGPARIVVTGHNLATLVQDTYIY